MLISEADIREKIITPWLSSIGIDAEGVKMEHSFKIRLGRGVYSIGSDKIRLQASGRADYLIKGIDNTNLFIIEAKAYGQTLTQEDRDQAISYARLLTDGNIAPFAILTNGHETIVYDTITKGIIKDYESFCNSSHIKRGFNVSCDIEAQTEALQHLLSLDSSNLLAFCKNQIEYRMKMLKSNDLYSGKKFIPQLYLPRERSETKLKELLFSERNPQQVVIVTGPPQHGKTSFLCNTVEKYIEEGIPCLFYPAIGLKSGLLSEIQEDFEWNYNSSQPVFSIVNRIKTLLSKSSQTLVLIIDGLNEVEQAKAFEISHALERILPTFKVIISATSNSLDRLLFENDNPLFLAENTKINRADTRQLKTKHLINTDKKSIIQILKFQNEEIHKAVSIYAKAYNVITNDSTKDLNNPFYLRIAMEEYAGSHLPAKINTSKLINQSLKRKASRAGVDALELKIILSNVCDLLFTNDTPITNLNELNIEFNLLQKLCEAAIFAEVHDENDIQGLDFYYSRDRDYAIAYELRKWDKLFLGEKNQIISELQASTVTSVGKESLRWFFSTSSHLSHLKNCYKEASSFELFDEIILFSILNQNFDNKEDLKWLNEVLYDIVKNEEDVSLRSAILYKLILTLQVTPQSITGNQIYLIKRLLIEESRVDDDEEIDFSESFSFELMTDYRLVEVYKSMLLDEDTYISEMSALLLAYNYEPTLVEIISDFIVNRKRELITNYKSFNTALNFIESREIQNDSYCPGIIDNMDSLEDTINAFLNFLPHFKIAHFYKKEKVFSYFTDLMNDIKSAANLFIEDKEQYESLDEYERSIADYILGNNEFYIDLNSYGSNPFQLYLPLDDEFSKLNAEITSTFKNIDIY